MPFDVIYTNVLEVGTRSSELRIWNSQLGRSRSGHGTRISELGTGKLEVETHNLGLGSRKSQLRTRNSCKQYLLVETALMSAAKSAYLISYFTIAQPCTLTELSAKFVKTHAFQVFVSLNKSWPN